MENFPHRLLACAAGIALAGCAMTTPPSSTTTEAAPGYVTGGDGNIARSGTGTCVRSGSWQPQRALRECEPELFAQADAEAKARADAEAAAAEQRAKAEAEAAAASAPAEEQQPVWKVVGAEALFDLNAAEPMEESKRVLDDIAQRALIAQEARLKIVGYADSSGDSEANMALSQRRADAVRAYLAQQGVPEAIIEVEARGDADPVVSCEGRRGGSLAGCLQPNRRSEIELNVLEPSDQ
jgi:OOP family OmpA-OmpF porin